MTTLDKVQRHRVRVGITATGALIVFATFVVKDNWRDDAKGLEDAIDNAENSFVIRNENARNFAELRLFEKRFREFRHNPTLPADSFSSGGDLGLPEYAPERVDDDEVALDNVGRLLRKVSEVTATDDKWRRLALTSRDIASFRDGFALYSRPSSEAVNEGDLISTFDRISAQTSSLTKDALRAAEDKRDSNEKLLRRLNAASYCLYLIGMAVAVIGAMIGVDTEP